MRYYEVHYPNNPEPALVTNVRALRDLPDGTRIDAIITDRDGSLVETYEVPVEQGRALVTGRNKRDAKLVRP